MHRNRWMLLISCIIIVFLMTAFKGPIEDSFSYCQNEEMPHYQRKESPRKQNNEASREQKDQSSKESEQLPSNQSETSSKNHSEKSSSNQDQETSTKNGDDCKALHFSKDPLPITALYSYPGSGNTWFRHLIHQATGIYTGSVCNSQDLKESGFLGEHVSNGSVIVVKTHRPYNVNNTHFEQAIVLIRNPADAIRAHYNLHLSQSQIEHAPVHDFKTERWSNFVSTKSSLWEGNYLSWIMFRGPLLFVQYDDLVQNLQSELRRILDFLGQDVSEEDVQCVLNNEEGQHHRSGVNFNFDLYTPEMKKHLNEIYTKIVNMYKDRQNH